MPEDPIVEEARKAGQAYIDSFHGDRDALLADLRRRAEQEGRQVVSLPPKPPEPQSIPTKKAG
jgi:hypothetical protein